MLVLCHNLQQKLNDRCTFKTRLTITQMTGLNFYRDLGIHGFCTWNENTVKLRLAISLLGLLFSLWLSLTSLKDSLPSLRLDFPEVQLCVGNNDLKE